MTSSVRSAPSTGVIRERAFSFTRSVLSGFSLVPGGWRVKRLTVWPSRSVTSTRPLRGAAGSISALSAMSCTRSFAASTFGSFIHSYERMKDPKVLAAKERVQLIADKALMDPAAPRSGRVEVTLRDGHTVSRFTRHPPGTKENPLSTERVNEKARSLMTPVLGAERTEEVIRRVNALEKLNEVRELRPFLAG